MERGWYHSLFVVIFGVVLLVALQPEAAGRRVVVPTDETAIAADWLLNGQTSIVEDAATRPFRWLTATPKQTVPALNHRLDLSLLHATAALAEWLGAPLWQQTTWVLQHEEPTTLRLTGVGQTLTLPVDTAVRRFTVLLPYGFHPTQTRVEPLTTQAYEHYGFAGDHALVRADDARPRLARWYSTTVQTLLPVSLVIALRVSVLLPLLLAVWWWYGGDWGRGLAPLATALVWCTPWLWATAAGQALDVEPIVAALVSMGSWTLLRRLLPAALPATRLVVAAAAVGMTGMHAYATAQWMSGVDLGQFGTLAAYVQYLRGMRMPFPIPLLTAEYFLSRLGIPGVLSVGYLTIVCRAALLCGIVLALAPAWQSRRGLWVGVGCTLLAVAGSGFVMRYYDRNVWMVYDALLGTSLVWLTWLLQHAVPRERRWWLLVGVTLAWLDSLRPFMMLVVPLLVLWLLLRARGSTPWRTTVWLLLPLLPNLVWHAYHIGVLGQLSWSSHAGMNIGRAWIPAAALDAMRNAPTDMNSSAYLAVSNALLAETRAWIIANPAAAFERTFALLGAMLVVPVEMSRLNDGGVYTVIVHPHDPLVWGYRLLLAGALLLQIVWAAVGWGVGTGWRQATWLHAVVVVGIIALTALTEYGEQARFIAALVPALLYGAWTSGTAVYTYTQQRWKTYNATDSSTGVSDSPTKEHVQ